MKEIFNVSNQNFTFTLQETIMAFLCSSNMLALFVGIVSLLFSSSFSASASTHEQSVLNITVVHMPEATPPEIAMAVQAAAGLVNRKGPLVYVITDADDEEWYNLLLAPRTISPRNISAIQFLQQSVAVFACIEYNARLSDAKLFFPSIITIAGVLDLIPLDAALVPRLVSPPPRVVFNATQRWRTSEQAVLEAASIGLNRTTALAFQDGSLVAKGWLVDHLVKERIFTQYLNRSCIPGTEDHGILLGLLAAAPWPRPVRVYGYNSADVIFGGDLFEAETDCANIMGQVATAHSDNLAFFSMLDPFIPGASQGQPGGPLLQPPSPHITYDSTKAYVALVYGDMDNVDFVERFGRQHMQGRAARCARPGRS